MWFNFRLTEKEHKRLKRRAKSCGLSMSGYVRQIINGYKPRESPPADYFAMTRELKESGNNLNQLAFVANATGLIDEAAYYEQVVRFHGWIFSSGASRKKAGLGWQPQQDSRRTK